MGEEGYHLLQECPYLAPKSTVFNFSIELADVDRGVYEQLKLPVALHPSESLEFMITRVLALALEYEEGITFSPGIASPDEPTVIVRGLDGALRLWVDIGSPTAERLHRAAKAAQSVAVYCHRSADFVYSQLLENTIFRGGEIRFISLNEGFVAQLVRGLLKRNELNISRSEQDLYVTINGESISCALSERRLG